MNSLVNLPARLWTYQGERFPLGRTSALTAVFSSASVCVSATFAGRHLPGVGAFTAAFVAVLATFFLMRAADEFKDRVDDARWRPERPVPRGLVTLGEIAGTAALTAVVALGCVVALAPSATPLLLLAWAWLALMTKEFFVPEFLRKRPFLYLVSHMAIMPLIDLFVTGCEWAPKGHAPPDALWLFLVLSFANGCVLEIGRKAWAPENEREGVETYSGLWGVRGASLAWRLCVTVAFSLLCGVAWAETAPLVVPLGAAAFGYASWRADAYSRAPTPVAQKRIEDAAGVWVLACYACAGFLPLLGVHL